MFLLTCITGPMKSGKSKLLIEYLTKAQSDGLEVRAYQPSIDSRQDGIRSRVGTSFPATKVDPGLGDGVEKGTRLFDWAVGRPGPSVIGLDEAMFFDKDVLYEAVHSLAISCGEYNYPKPPKIWLIISGLLRDSDAHKWLPVDRLTMLLLNRHNWPVDHIELTATCERCGRPADETFCKIAKDKRIVVGDAIYEPRCRSCWNYGEMLK